MRKSLQQQREDLKSNNRAKYSSEQLKRTVTKSIETVMIGALDDFEKRFGELWGHGKRVEDKTEDELAEYDIWQSTRKSILDRGEVAKNICLDVIGRCVITDYDNKQYKYKFVEKTDE